ncbi:MAG TPA: hypothetical protein VMT00_01430 [Thermoanaerobaculia bacterium]|nr:hypothetical protein [Thermoanaerobaculia bacterium]
MYTQRKPIENAHIVRERDRQRFRELLAVFSLGIPIGLFLLLFTWENLEVIRLGREASRLQTTKRELEGANKKLQVEIERLTSLDEVEARATQLGFRATDGRSVILVVPPPPDVSVGSPDPQAQVAGKDLP